MKILFRMLLAMALTQFCAFNADADDVPPSPSPKPSVTFNQIVVPRGTLVRVTIDEELDGYRNLAGSKLHFKVVDAVKVDGSEIVQKGDVGVGTIQDGGHGLLKISIDKVYTFCGDVLEMDYEFTAPDRRRAFAAGAPSQIHKNTQFEPVTLHLQRACIAP